MAIKKKLYTPIAVLAIVLLIAIIALIGTYMRSTFEQEDVRMAEDTVRKYAVQCYALEGAYPESIEYLADNYTLTLNREKYVYHYDYIGANMMPDISVFAIEK